MSWRGSRSRRKRLLILCQPSLGHVGGTGPPLFPLQVWLGKVDEAQTPIHPETPGPTVRRAQPSRGRPATTGRSLLQIDSQMETSCKIPFQFVNENQLVSYGYLQAPTGMHSSGRVEWEHEGWRSP